MKDADWATASLRSFSLTLSCILKKPKDAVYKRLLTPTVLNLLSVSEIWRQDQAAAKDTVQYMYLFVCP